LIVILFTTLIKTQLNLKFSTALVAGLETESM
jgi:hypothetical protein